MCKNNFDNIENKDDKLVVSHHNNVASLLDVDANFCLSELRDHHSLTIREPLVEICYECSHSSRPYQMPEGRS